jgi:hypothetical protein
LDEPTDGEAVAAQVLPSTEEMADSGENEDECPYPFCVLTKGKNAVVSQRYINPFSHKNLTKLKETD